MKDDEIKREVHVDDDESVKLRLEVGKTVKIKIQGKYVPRMEDLRLDPSRWRFGLLDRLLMRVLRFRVIPDSCGEPYLVRYYLRGSADSDGFAVYLHHILKSDEDRDLHDHPWDFWSFILWRGYVEVTPAGARRFFPLSLLRRPATYSHRLILERPAWTLVVRSGRKRKWGFHTPKGWVYWKNYEKAGRPC